METRKIAVACFIGGALCCAVAFMFAPVYWWFGLIAGMAGGYIGYEFREVRKAIPITMRAVGRGSVYAWDGAIVKAKAWFSEPHPFFYPAAIMVAPFYIWGVSHLIPEFVGSTMSVGSTALLLIMVSLGILAFVEMVCAVILLVVFLAFIGARIGEKCYWWPFFLYGVESDVQELEARGLRRESMNYPNLLRWFMKGLGLTVLFFVWTPWKRLTVGVWTRLCFLGRFAWRLFKLIHSDKRILCAIDGTLGGAASYLSFASSAMSFPEQIVLVIFGGFLGAAFGVANWEIVSNRILHVSTSA
ncbi:MAG: hypothetical protein A3J55_01505 [Candidatus Ryanbacteria bacterium RIFCSPHIGHO2_02_FULL_45_17b]|uniref:Uncharacterized protein n=1 Tax=Candidatus Ryanbacteria bacterium RIFCSPHIGHO2_01_FULL_45_22 TaxID=1802114 RepID=A0A1G2G169_9BACT|nr:MAG: hypothetical protein A2719_00320 [Candidatus Ryanbacteria bacterium RIFCSPHIGHO2_01_FULL_45_22]OGZ47444.1 MAG: hypothetical protein A3J55_01505 [Candidatus Ryanbacteria bacterium RIFCSPHIGHO2_02_FULL_45_17b]